MAGIVDEFAYSLAVKAIPT